MSAPQVSIENGTLVVVPSHKLLSLHGTFHLPLSDVSGVVVLADPGEPVGLKIGAGLPGIIECGTWETGEGQEFWDVARDAPSLEITCSGGRYTRLVLGVADPERAREQVAAALSG